MREHPPALCLDSVSVRLGGATIVSGITLQVPPGQWLALLGPNGAGKSTLLRACAGLIPASGTLRVGDLDARTLSRRGWARRLAYVPQRPVLPAGLSVADYVLLGRTPHLGLVARTGREDQAAVAGVLTQLDLGVLAGRRLGTLSGGEQQRAVLGRALAQQADLLLLDEPTSALDVGHQQQVLELVDSARRAGGLTVVAAMHDLTLASQYADRVALLSAGKLVATGAPQDVLTQARVAEHYDAEVSVTAGAAGSVVVVPRRPAPDGEPPAPRR